MEAITCDKEKSIVVNGVTYYEACPEIKKEKKLTGWEEPVSGSKAYNIDAGSVSGVTANMSYLPETYASDKNRHQHSAIFADEDFAKQYARHETLWRNIAQWQALNDDPVDINNCGYAICYNKFGIGVKFVTDIFNSSFGNCVLFATAKAAQDCMEEFLEELKWDKNEFKWRLDA